MKGTKYQVINQTKVEGLILYKWPNLIFIKIKQIKHTYTSVCACVGATRRGEEPPKPLFHLI
ncbi:hypothetical protein HanHA89_Chr01g0013041 [Helianthus annuus]|nr:hypothetical protein HanHA89_Chr01g0013041 [Helianthus annuus]